MRSTRRNLEAIPATTDTQSSRLRPRTTVFFPEALEFNLDLVALVSGRPKAEIIREALAVYLQEKYKLQPYEKTAIALPQSAAI